MEQRELLDQLGELLLRLRLARQLGATVRLPFAQLGQRARLDSQLSEHAATLHGREPSFATCQARQASLEVQRAGVWAICLCECEVAPGAGHERTTGCFASIRLCRPAGPPPRARHR